MSGEARARAQHYFFAHRALPGLFESDPGQFMALLLRDGDRFLRYYWDDLGHKVTNPRDRVEGGAPHVQFRKAARDIQVALIAMPQPEYMTEAYFVAPTYHPQLDRAIFARYFTLEYSISILDNKPYTVLGGWSGSTHMNMGSGPEPDLEAFYSAIDKLLASQPS